MVQGIRNYYLLKIITMENYIKIEMHDDNLIRVEVVGQANELSSMLAAAIQGDKAMNEILTQAMIKIVASEEMERIEEIKKANLN